ncbi:Gfo/Idh/MocA family protein [Nonomuraea endophytica]|uniref:Putative dehydrogenase n=1 Tax=Nonomuraea endophytica TaxID=714136 RepID=A0A7W8AAD0_9ACTN|nr:Gfo/Idh/MocA family oxidoreductase [Nonomuraea endophytica]MBB5082498.1 putative dehydrogenase [Nonomuraea endophytica]
MRKVTLAIAGAGNRGQTYASWIAAHPGRAELVAVADPDPARRRAIGALSPGVQEFDDWRDLLSERVADAVILSTQDRLHVEPAIALAGAGYALLMEKPLAPTEEECRRIVRAVSESGVLFAVCHVLRYTPYTELVKRVAGSGVIGEIMSVEHLEPVGWWHHAHSYVRGPWRSERLASPMLLAKSSHDLDWLTYVTGRRIRRVSSFGSLGHFRPDRRPAGAADRCLDCPIEPVCPYSAPGLYLNRGYDWPTSVLGGTEAEVMDALRTGPYGRCVYASDNDVVDHQVLAMELSGGATATFTMSAFTEQTHRQTKIFGTHGRLIGDGESVEVLDFRDSRTTRWEGASSGSNAGDGHGGGDAGVMDAFVSALATGDRSFVRSDHTESLHSHLAVFAAERARHTGTVVTVPHA